MKTEGKRRRGRKIKQLLDNLQDNRRYWNFEEKSLEGPL
jgi:hypothetical protein